MAMTTRLADIRLWADGVGATAEGGLSLDHRFKTRPDDLMLVKSMLIMLGDFLDEYAQYTDTQSAEALQHIDATIENLAVIGVAIRRTGKASRRRKADQRFDPSEHTELRRHLEAIVLMRPSKDGLRTQLPADQLTVVQRRLVDANLKRRHRFVLAQKRSKSSSSQPAPPPSQPVEELAEDTVDKPLSAVPTAGRKGRTLQRERIIPTKGTLPEAASQSHASTAEGSLQYQPRRKFIPEVAKTQITALAADAEFPRPPRLSNGRLVGKCPCCCQSIHRDDFVNPTRWK